jgi:hypothetical protein
MGTFWVKISSKNVRDEVRPHICFHNHVQNLILIILEKKVKKMLIFDYFRGFLVFNTKKWPFLLNKFFGTMASIMVYTLNLDKEKDICLNVCSVGKLL